MVMNYSPIGVFFLSAGIFSVYGPAIIGPYVTIADEGVIKNSIVRDSIIDERAHIEGAMLSESLIGRDAKVSGSFERLNVGDSSQVDFAGREAR